MSGRCCLGALLAFSPKDATGTSIAFIDIPNFLGGNSGTLPHQATHGFGVAVESRRRVSGLYSFHGTAPVDFHFATNFWA